MAKIEIYTTSLCPYCVMAKRLLAKKKLDYVETDLWQHPTKREEMLAKSNGRHTVPQIFIDGEGIGGCDELHALERSGELDQMLNAAG